jgi:SAM-dependent methyltransferase
MADTRDSHYTDRLRVKQDVLWKRVLRVQAPYHWNVKRQSLGRTLDIGCGIGRNLAYLSAGSVGVDHNRDSVLEARRRGFAALTVEEWESSDLRVEQSFDSLLLAHVVEHMAGDEARALVNSYLPYLRPGGRAFFICPQERGYASDATHVEFVDGEGLCALAADVGLVPQRSFSFPLPRFFGRAFVYNEFCVLATKPAV